MQVVETGFPGLLVLEPKVFEDERGFFMETYNKKVYAEHAIHYDFVQDNHARSEQKGVLRGLHFQLPPHAQTKLVWVNSGSVLDVAVDLRTDSPMFGKWYSIVLSARNRKRLLIPKGFGHGYATLEAGVEFLYKVDEYYAPKEDSGIRWNDPDLGVDWGDVEPILSDKDTNLQLMKDFTSPFRME